MSEVRRRPGPDSTLDDVRSKLIHAGINLLGARGVELGIGDITLSDTIAEAEVTRSTAYRSLADDELSPQSVLQREILIYLVAGYTRGDTRQEIEDAITTEVDRQRTVFESGTCRERTAAMRSVIRLGANTSYLGVIDNPERAILTAVYGSVRSSPNPPDWRHKALTDGELGLTAMFKDFYLGLTVLFDYRVKDPFTMDQFTVAGASLLEGIAMRHEFNDQVKSMSQRQNLDGEPEDWTLFAVAFEALIIGMCEPANPDDPFADLANY
jgi:hypothetical protein